MNERTSLKWGKELPRNPVHQSCGVRKPPIEILTGLIALYVLCPMPPQNLHILTAVPAFYVTGFGVPKGERGRDPFKIPKRTWETQKQKLHNWRETVLSPETSSLEPGVSLGAVPDIMSKRAEASTTSRAAPSPVQPTPGGVIEPPE